MKLKTAFFLLFILINSPRLSAQPLTKDYMSGTWKVVSSKLLPDMETKADSEGIAKREIIMKAFINTKFYFEKNELFKMEFPVSSPAFMKELEFVNNKSWTIAGKETIKIGAKENLMNIIVRKFENKIYFLLDETPFLLEVIKLK